MRLIDLFAGCGGMTLGFRRAGFDPVLAVESDLHAAATYAANFGEDHVLWSDITEIDLSVVPKADVVIGGPPCQGFSNLGTRDPDDPRNRLWRDFIDVVVEAEPLVFVIENVDRFASSTEYVCLCDAVDHGALSDYQLSETAVLNAADYGVPQRRRRAIVIGSRVGAPTLPPATHARDVGLGLGIEPWVTVRVALDGVPLEPEGTELPDSRTEFFDQSVPGPFKGPDIHIGRNPRRLSLKRYDCIPPGGGRFDLPEDLLPPCWANKPEGTTDVMGRLVWDEPAVTIRTEFFKPEKGRYLHPQYDVHDPSNRVNRPITHREAALLQTFPDDFQWCGSKIQIARQIGNAVPPLLAEVIARHVARHLSSE